MSNSRSSRRVLPKESKMPKAHPIQLVRIDVIELNISCKTPAAEFVCEKSDVVNYTSLQIGIGHSKFDETDSTIVVSMSIGTRESSELPFNLSIEICGIFKIDTQRFNKENISHWAKNGAHYILLPYLREYLYSLTQRAGYEPVILPLIEVNTLSYSDN